MFAPRIFAVDEIRARVGLPRTARTLLASTTAGDQLSRSASSSCSMTTFCHRSQTPAARHYSVLWDNVTASSSIPEPAVGTLTAGLAALGLAFWHRRRASSRARTAHG